MKAIGKLAKKPGLTLYDAPMPQIGATDLLIKIRQTSLCGTDMHIYNWDEWAEKTIPVPVTTGHEFYGVVEATGQDIRNFKKGDRVSGEGHIICGQCKQCREGHFHLCPNTQGIGVQRTGCFAEYLALPAFNACKLPDTISDDVATILDPFGNAVHTALTYNLVGEDVLITGAGPIGIMAAAIAQKIGARTVVLTDISDERLALAEKMGIHHTCNPLNGPLPLNTFTVGLEMSGAQAALTQMIELMATGGKIALLGILPTDTHIDGTKIIFKSLQLQGIYGREMFETWHKALALIEEGLDLTPIITHKFPYTAFEQAFDTVKQARCGKVILTWYS